MAARWAHNPKVTGSSPVPATPSEQFEKGCSLFLLAHGNLPILAKSLITPYCHRLSFYPSIALTTALLHLALKAFSRQTYMYVRHSYLICWQQQRSYTQKDPLQRGDLFMFMTLQTFRDESCKTKTTHKALPLIDCTFQSCTSPRAVAGY